MSKTIYPQITIRVSQFEFNRFLKLKTDYGLSARDVIEYQTCPCERCKNLEIVVFDKKAEPFVIPKTIISKRK